jgi:large subunit ribosomal protein L4
MPSVPLIGPDGQVGAVDLPDAAFAQPFHEPLVHECAVAELAARRRGTAATRNRALVRGGGAKPYRQKGTGRARQGSIRAPQFAGGGTVFGPSPRHYTGKVNRKARKAALRAVLSLHATRGSLAALDAGAFAAPSTRAADATLSAYRPQLKRALVLAAEGEEAVLKSFRNLPRAHVLPAADAGVADVVGAQALVATERALRALAERAVAARAAEVGA